MRLITQGNTGRYTVAQLEAAVVSPAARIGPRFEVFDLTSSDPIGELSMVSGASIDMDASRAISRGLHLTFPEADPLLPWDTTVPFTRLIKPWFRLGMPDGGIVEWPQGVYVWQPPTRNIVSVDPYGLEEPVATWDVTLGDQAAFLLYGGPGPRGWNIPPNTNISGAIAETLTRGMPFAPDLSGIETGTAVTAGPLTWMLLGHANPTVGSSMPGAPATSWMTILQRLHDGSGAAPPWFDDDGKYVARPMPVYNLFAADPDITFTCDRKHLVEVPINQVPDVARVGNRVYVQANNANANALQGVAVADANDWLPNHPYAQKNCGIYVDVTDTEGVAGEYGSLQARAVATLFQRMGIVNQLSISTQFRPGLEPWDIVGLIVPADPVYGSLRRLMATKWTTDLFTGVMQHQPASISGG